GDYAEAIPQSLYALHCRVGQDRCLRRDGVALQECDQVWDGHEVIRGMAVVLESRKAGHPVRRQQMQRIPAVAAPTLRQLPTLEHDVLDAELGQAAAHRETCLSAADDDRRRTRHGAFQRVSMLTSTGTPLVSTSKTAERARDCSTISRSFSGGASPAIVKLMRMRSE